MGHRLSIDIDKHFSDRTRPVLALSGTYPPAHHVRPHSHKRSQLFCPMTGVAVATTSQGAWAVPATRGLWIPASVRHELRMQGVVSMFSLYFEPAAVPAMPNTCQVLAISPLMRSLIEEAVKLPVRYAHEGRSGALMQLIQHEITTLPELPLSIPLPVDRALATLCREFLAHPSATDDIDEWAARLGKSRRTFTRLFRQQTGMSFVTWRQQVCVLSSLPRFAAGASVTDTAFHLGFENPAAFTSLFKKLMGAPPNRYMAGDRAVSRV